MSDDNATIEEPIVACLDCKFYESDNNVAYCTRCAHKTLLCRMASCNEFRIKKPIVEIRKDQITLENLHDELKLITNKLIYEYGKSTEERERRYKEYELRLKKEYDERLRLALRKDIRHWLIVSFLGLGTAFFVFKLFIEPFL